MSKGRGILDMKIVDKQGTVDNLSTIVQGAASGAVDAFLGLEKGTASSVLKRAKRIKREYDDNEVKGRGEPDNNLGSMTVTVPVETRVRGVCFERKFVDTALSYTLAGVGATSRLDYLALIAQGDAYNQRSGCGVKIVGMEWRGYVQDDGAVQSAYADCYNVDIVIDREPRGAVPAFADIYTRFDQGFLNGLYEGRFARVTCGSGTGVDGGVVRPETNSLYFNHIIRGHCNCDFNVDWVMTDNAGSAVNVLHNAPFLCVGRRAVDCTLRVEILVRLYFVDS